LQEYPKKLSFGDWWNSMSAGTADKSAVYREIATEFGLPQSSRWRLRRMRLVYGN
jgi:hypothetical protein